MSGPAYGDEMIDVEALRQSARQRAASRPRPAFDGVIREEHVGVVATRSYTPHERMTDAIVYFSHGGYGVFGDLDLQDAYCRRLATVLHRRVVAVDYRLAPENSFFDAVDDLESCVRVQAGTTGVILCGDSAGGAVSVAVGERIGATVRALMLTNPNLDLTLQSFDRQALQGPDCELNIVDGRGHGFMSDPGSADLALRRAGAFIRRHLAVP